MSPHNVREGSVGSREEGPAKKLHTKSKEPNAIQKRETKSVDARKQTKDSEKVG